MERRKKIKIKNKLERYSIEEKIIWVKFRRKKKKME
jgi:hypothetical protein